MYKQTNMFDGEFPKTAPSKKSKNYKEFLKKFERKKTTDDCYTPPKIYETVKNFFVEMYGLQCRKIVRPFYPGGDYENYDYPENCVVIDNPPFSIYRKILKFYCERNIDFVLFGPGLTLIANGVDCCYYPINSSITYANGATISTGFASNLDKFHRVRTLPELCKKLKYIAYDDVASKPVNRVPDCVTSGALLKKISDVKFDLRKDECFLAQNVGGKKIFGNALIMSDAATKRKLDAERKHEELKSTKKRRERQVNVIELDEINAAKKLELEQALTRRKNGN